MATIKHKKLLAYSGSASIFIFCNSVQSQVVYADIDPDKYLSGENIFDIDMDGDGIIDIQCEGDDVNIWSYGSGFSTQRFKINNFISVAYNDDFIYLRPLMFSLGEEIDNTLPFINLENLLFFSAANEYDDYGDDVDIYTGGSLINIDSYVGVKLIISGEPHYGWIRLSVTQIGESMPFLIIKDYAFNSIPNEPLEIIQFSASEAKELVLSDIGETNTAADLQLNFEKAPDESTVSAYRVILYTGYGFPTLAEANALSPDRFTEILPTGSDISLIFNEETLDIDGNLLLPETNYRAVVLSVADGIAVEINSLSVASEPEQFDPDYATPVTTVYLSDISNNNNISDLRVNFYPSSTTGVQEYRIFISNDYAPDMDFLLTLDSTYYRTLDAEGLSYSLTCDTLLNIYDCITPHLFERYFASVISMPDGILASLPQKQIYTGIEYFLDPDYDEVPLVSISDLTGTVTDINVQFPKFEFEEDLLTYRIVVVKDEHHSFFSNSDAAALSPAQYVDLVPTGNDLNITLPSGLKDVDGHLILSGTVYRVIVLLKGASPAYYSMAIPSEPFTLPEPVTVETNITDKNIFFENNVLFIQLANDIEQNLIIVNAMGQEILRDNINRNTATFDLNFLAPGVYFCLVGNNNDQSVAKIVIAK